MGFGKVIDMYWKSKAKKLTIGLWPTKRLTHEHLFNLELNIQSQLFTAKAKVQKVNDNCF